MHISNLRDFNLINGASDDVIETTKRIQRCCHIVFQELAECARQGELPRDEYDEIRDRLVTLHACAAEFLKEYGN